MLSSDGAVINQTFDFIDQFAPGQTWNFYGYGGTAPNFELLEIYIFKYGIHF